MPFYVDADQYRRMKSAELDDVLMDFDERTKPQPKMPDFGAFASGILERFDRETEPVRQNVADFGAEVLRRFDEETRTAAETVGRVSPQGLAAGLAEKVMEPESLIRGLRRQSGIEAGERAAGAIGTAGGAIGGAIGGALGAAGETLKPIGEEIFRSAPIGGTIHPFSAEELQERVKPEPFELGPFKVANWETNINRPFYEGLRKLGVEEEEAARTAVVGTNLAFGAGEPIRTPGAPKVPKSGKAAAEAEMQAAFGKGILRDVAQGNIAESALRPEQRAAMQRVRPPEEGFAGNIRLEKYPEEVQEIIQRSFDAMPMAEEVAARRGIITDDTLRDLASMAGEKLEKVVKRWKPGEAQNAETLLALRESLGAQARRVLAAQQSYKAADTTENLALLTEELMKQRSLQEVVKGSTAEAGRALRQFRLATTATDPEGMLDFFLKRWGGKLSKDDLARLMKDVDFSDPTAVAGAAKQLWQPTNQDRFWAYWYFNLLSSPITHIRNTVSNMVTTLSKPLEATAAAPIDAARARLTGTQRERFIGEVPAQFAGMGHALKEGSRQAVQIMRRGFSEAEASVKPEIGQREAFSGRLADLTVNVPGRALRASDVFFRTLNRTAEIYGQAYRIAKQEGLSGEAFIDRVAELRHSPTEEMLKVAELEATYRVFQQDGSFVRAMGNLRNAAPPVRFAVPFIQTPYNITKYALERTPLGYLGVAADVARGRTKGGNLSDRLARASMGSAIFAGLTWRAFEGDITGAPPRDAAARDAFYRQGKQPYSVRIGGTWHSYQSMQPFSVLFAAAAATADAVNKGQDTDALTGASHVAFAMARSMIDMPWTQGLAQALDALDNPEMSAGRYAEQTVPPLVVPGTSLWRFVARAVDSTLRDPEGPVESVMAGIPGLSERVQPRLDAMGREVQRQPQQRGVGTVNPFSPAEATKDPVETELERLQAKGFKVQPGFVTGSLMLGGEPVKLERGEKFEYQKYSGQLAYGVLLSVVGTPEWEALSDQDKAATVQVVFQRAREFMRKELQPGLIPRAAGQYARRRFKEIQEGDGGTSTGGAANPAGPSTTSFPRGYQ